MKQQFSLALVTGASSGIGQAICDLLAAKKIPLLISARNEQKLQELAAEWSKQVPVTIVVADLAQPNGRALLIEKVHSMVPDLVINNAGLGLYGEALTYTTEEQLEIFEVNGKAVLEITLEAARTLISKERKGTILNVSSAAGFYIFPEFTVYAASKTFVNQLSQALDNEMRPHGVRVLSACPGVVETDFRRRAARSERMQKSPMANMTSAYAAEAIWSQIQQGCPLRIFNWKYSLLRMLAYFIPPRWIAPSLKRTIETLHPPRTIIKL